MAKSSEAKLNRANPHSPAAPSTAHNRRQKWQQRLRQVTDWSSNWLTAPTIAGVIILLRSVSLLQPYEWMAYDQYMRLRPAEPPDKRIVIIGADEDDLRQLKQWPLRDQTLATLLANIKRQNPAAIGLDIFRDFPMEPGHQDLVAIFNNTPNLVGIEKRGGEYDAPVGPPPALKAKDQVASNDIVEDGDGKIRRAMLLWASPNGEETQATLGFDLALRYLQSKHKEIAPEIVGEAQTLKLGQTLFPAFRPTDGSYINADAGGYQIMLNYRGGVRSFRTVSLVDVLNNKVPPDLFEDRLVFIGATAYSVKDIFYTPFSSNAITTPERMSGVEIQANIASQILSSTLEGRQGIQSWDDWQENGWILGWACLGAGLGWVARKSPRWASAGMVIALGSLFLSCYGLFINGWWVPLVPTAIALTTSAGVLISYIAYKEREDRHLIMNLFGRHVNPEIAEAIWRDRAQILEQGRLPGRHMIATVLFTDLQDFSTVSERTDPDVLMDWLNEYMDSMSQIVLQHNGIVDKFIGDSVMAIFGVPILRSTQAAIAQDARDAIHCALDMATALEKLNADWQRRGRPTTAMRIGISSGPVITGSLGGKQRLDYTTIGDSVNVASRLESFDKSFQVDLCRILISETTYESVKDEFPVQFVTSVQLRGREQPTRIYQILLKSS
jgi:adenylate cyclase